jgi:predicted metal-dependent hydrolase
MRVRRPAVDFSQTRAHWAAIPEFAQSMNASSLWIPHLERFLNRVMARTIQEGRGNPAIDRLRDDVKDFVRQETNHYSLHAAFNEVLARSGYDRIAEFEALFKAAFEKLITERSLAFLCAYCEGFETLGPPSAIVWLDEIEDLLQGADTNVVRLWKWHLLEEYEHRAVCHDVYNAVHGGYFLRLRVLFFQFRQLQGFSKMVREHILATDRCKMTRAERRESIARQRRVSRRIAWLTLPRLIRALSPFYDPRKCPEPRHFRSYMVEVEKGLG